MTAFILRVYAKIFIFFWGGAGLVEMVGVIVKGVRNGGGAGSLKNFSYLI